MNKTYTNVKKEIKRCISKLSKRGNTRNLKTALWAFPYTPSEKQLAEIENLGYKIVDLTSGIVLGSININDYNDVIEFMSSLFLLSHLNQAYAVFGEFPTPIQERIHLTANSAVRFGEWPENPIVCYSSWKSTSCDNSNSMLTHKKFCCIGALCRSSI